MSVFRKAFYYLVCWPAGIAYAGLVVLLVWFFTRDVKPFKRRPKDWRSK